MAALAIYSSPKNSAIKGKQDNPGAKDGTNILTVLAMLEDLGIFKKNKNKGVTQNNKPLNAKAINGKATKLLLMFIFKSATKIMAGSASVNITFFKPFTSSFENLFFNNTPIKINRMNDKDLPKVSFITP